MPDPTRFIGLDIHKFYMVAAGVDADQNETLPPQRVTWERFDAWMAMSLGQARVVVGARSAVFAPLPNLRLIVVDEEHEPSFKQGETPMYHGRDVAVMRASILGAACVLGSATPSLETWKNATAGRYAPSQPTPSARNALPTRMVTQHERTSRSATRARSMRRSSAYPNRNVYS